MHLYSETKTTTVSAPVAPPTPSVSAPSTDDNGCYSVSWSSSGATSYQVQESTTQRGSFSANFHNGSGTSKTASKGNGVYYYRAKACHGSNCSGVSGWKKVIVAIKPGIPGAISTSPSSPTEGSNFNVPWGASSGSVSKYELRRGSSLIYSSSGTTKTNENVSAGSYAYKVKACKTVSTFTSCSGERTKTVSVGLQRSTISLTGNASVTEGGTLSFGISRTGGTSQGQSVSVSVINGSASTSDNDYSAPASSITFSPGQTSKTISVSTIGDSKYENNESFTLGHL